MLDDWSISSEPSSVSPCDTTEPSDIPELSDDDVLVVRDDVMDDVDDEFNESRD